MKDAKLTAYNKLLMQSRRKSLASFSDMDFRLQSVLVKDNVEWINDSKSVDLRSTHYALSVFNAPIHWVLELDGNEYDYSILEDLVRYQVKSIVCYGIFNSEFEQLFGGVVDDYKFCSDLEAAIEFTKDIVNEFDVVLFSSGCYPADGSSFIERGKTFNRVLKRSLNA